MPKNKVPVTETTSSAIKPISLAILWHQHQPYYRAGNTFLLPWAWLHATKDYLEMAQHFEREPKMRGTINLVPSLLLQLEQYLSQEADDPVLRVMRKGASLLSNEEKDILLNNFFLANDERVIGRSPCYKELHQRSIAAYANAELRRNAFSEQDYRDLAVHYALAWTGEFTRAEEPCRSLIAKDRDYTEAERDALMECHRAVVRKIIPLHRKLMERGQIEVTTSPFYHPILPLLIDTESALEAMPHASLPIERFRAPEEAAEQLNRAFEYYKHEFGTKPRGVWPSEGSVSEATIELIAKAGFPWTATDETILHRSLVGANEARLRYARYYPWKRETQAKPVVMFFRDHDLSDRIGFTYQTWKPEDAVRDFIGRILEIRDGLIQASGEATLETACISVILDGENCWEYYENNGKEFLSQLYAALTTIPEIAPCTFSERVAHVGLKNLETLPSVAAGSWIDGNFRIWIGHPEDNAAWDAVADAKRVVDSYRSKIPNLEKTAKASATSRLAKAHEELLIAEGSDWCWWYGDEHFTVQKSEFDDLFRLHLRAVYVWLDLPVPAVLAIPIQERPDIAALYARTNQPSDTRTPTLTGKRIGIGWSNALIAKPPKQGAMRRASVSDITSVLVGHDDDELFLRIELANGPAHPHTFRVEFEQPHGLELQASAESVAIRGVHGVLTHSTLTARAMIDEVAELSIPLAMLHGASHLCFAIEITTVTGEHIVVHREPPERWFEVTLK
ncbi:MAG: glycoside hydrolase family 57 protein [Candidatus Kapaibacterium sp.]|jgi:alpha-amylase/alpha-mannosidase (GH57 family)